MWMKCEGSRGCVAIVARLVITLVGMDFIRLLMTVWLAALARVQGEGAGDFLFFYFFISMDHLHTPLQFSNMPTEQLLAPGKQNVKVLNNLGL